MRFAWVDVDGEKLCWIARALHRRPLRMNDENSRAELLNVVADTSEICTPSSMSGKEKRSDGLFGERGNERRCAPQAPPVLHATALLLDSTPHGSRRPDGGRGRRTPGPH